MTDWGDLPMAANHVDELTRSAISAEVAAERGYQTAKTIRELKRLGFAESQCLVPGLLIPVHGIGGEPEGYQFKPDRPRTKDGKVVKYESPRNAPTVLDVPRRARRWVMDGSLPLVFTEGCKKSDAGACHEMAVVSIAGVWNWRGEQVVAALDQIPLKGRTVYLAFDSDWQRKESVRGGLNRFAAVLRSRGAEVSAVCLPEPTPGQKVGLDDYFAAGHGPLDLFNLTTVELTADADADAAAEAAHPTGPYAVLDGRICYHKREREGDFWIPLAEFVAVIAEEVIADDGLSERGEYVIAGSLPDGSPLVPVRVPLGSFEGLSWVGKTWGSRAIVAAGMGTRDRLREAIQRLSSNVVRRREFTHPGWREVDGTWHFLHAGGAIGTVGTVSVDQVRLTGPAGRIRLPDPPSDRELQDAVRTALSALDVAPDRITVPLFGMVYRAPLNAARYADLAGWLTGPTGTMKSELAALAQAHFGEFDRLSLPANWAATANALERVAFDFKDALLVIDDFAPSGSSVDVARLHATAERVLRGAGNAAGRGRMNADGTLRPDYPPRALILGTGEDVPRGHSIRARTVVVEVEPEDVDGGCLATLQAESGRLALRQAMAGYLQWLAGRYDQIRDEIPLLAARFRRELVMAGQHARTPEAIANLAVGWHSWLRFAQEVGALDEAEREAVWERVWRALADVAGAQAIHLVDENPATRFLRLLSSAITTGTAHVASVSNEAPPDPSAWGWQFRTFGSGLSERSEWQPRGACVGWVDGDNLYLDPAGSYAVAQRLGTSGAGGLTVAERALHKGLRQGGHLRTTDPGRGRLTVRIALGNGSRGSGDRRHDRRVPVLHLGVDAILLTQPSQPSQPSQNGDIDRPSPATPGRDLRSNGAGSRANGDFEPNVRPAGRPENLPEPATDPGERGTVGTVGTVVHQGGLFSASERADASSDAEECMACGGKREPGRRYTCGACDPAAVRSEPDDPNGDRSTGEKRQVSRDLQIDECLRTVDVPGRADVAVEAVRTVVTVRDGIEYEEWEL